MPTDGVRWYRSRCFDGDCGVSAFHSSPRAADSRKRAERLVWTLGVNAWLEGYRQPDIRG